MPYMADMDLQLKWNKGLDIEYSGQVFIQIFNKLISNILILTIEVKKLFS